MNVKEHLQRLRPNIQLKHLLVDTNFLIDVYKNPTVFEEILSFFLEEKIVLATIFPVVAEFLRGISILKDYRKKKEYLDSIIQITLPIGPKIQEDILRGIIPAYREKGGLLSITDFLLAGVLMYYKNSPLILLTRNHRDFPTTIFDRIDVLPVEYEYEIQTFGFYRFSDSKFKKVLEDLIKIDESNQSR